MILQKHIELIILDFLARISENSVTQEHMA